MSLRHLAAALLCVLALGARPALADDPGFASELERVASSTPAEKVSYVQGAVVEIGNSFAAIELAYGQAKADDDNKAIQCIQSRHTAVQALVSVTQQAERDMIAAVKAGNIERADHEFRKVAVALQRTRMLHAEADRCVSGQELTDGETSIQVLLDDDEDEILAEFNALLPQSYDLGFDAPDISPFR